MFFIEQSQMVDDPLRPEPHIDEPAEVAERSLRGADFLLDLRQRIGEIDKEFSIAVFLVAGKDEDAAQVVLV